MSALRVVAVSALLGLTAAAPAHAAGYRLTQAADPGSTPAGFTVSGREAITTANHTGAVAGERRKGALRAEVFILLGRHEWQVSYIRGGKERARAVVDGLSGRIVGKVWTGPYVAYPIARGTKSAFRDRLDVALVVMSILFVLPFFDPRRLRRMVHLDVLAFVAFVPPLLLLNTGHLYAAVPLQYVPLLYLLGRLVWVGMRGRAGGSDPLAPWATMRVLSIGMIVLAVARAAFNLEWGPVGDVGYAGVFGADSLHHGWHLYTVHPTHLDTYGPLNYLLYLPFEAVFPIGPGWQAGSLAAAHAAAICFDLAVVGLILVLSARLRLGRAGVAIAYAWLAYPLTLLPLAVSANDAIVAVGVLLALLAARSPLGRGVMLGLGGAAKFAPLALVPLFGPGPDRSVRQFAITCGAAAAVIAIAFLPYIHQSGARTVWDSTLGFQLSRSTPFTLWGLHPSLGWLRHLAQALVLGVIAASIFYPRKRTPLRLAALAAATILAVQMAGNYWAFTYVAWFAAPAFFALLGGAAVTVERARASHGHAPAAVAASTSG